MLERFSLKWGSKMCTMFTFELANWWESILCATFVSSPTTNTNNNKMPFCIEQRNSWEMFWLLPPSKGTRLQSMLAQWSLRGSELEKQKRGWKIRRKRLAAFCGTGQGVQHQRNVETKSDRVKAGNRWKYHSARLNNTMQSLTAVKCESSNQL